MAGNGGYESSAVSSATSGTQEQADNATQLQQVTSEGDDDNTLNAQWEQLQKDQKAAEEANPVYEQHNQTIQDARARIANMPSVPLPEHEDYPPPPDPNAQKRTVGNILGQVISMGLIGAAVFGRSRNKWANAAMYSGAGSFIQGFTKGQNDAAKEQLQNWNKLVEYNSKINQEKDRTYNQILANKRLDLAQQMDVIHSVATRRGDLAMYKAVQSRDLNNIMKVIDDKMKAHKAFTRAQAAIVSRSLNQWMAKTKAGKTWGQYVVDQSAKDGHPLDPAKDYLEAMGKYPISNYLNDVVFKPAKTKPDTVESMTRAANTDLGGNKKGGPWVDRLVNQGSVEQGDFNNDGEWVGNPKGKLYSFSDTEETGHKETDTERLKELKTHAITESQFNRLKTRVEKYKAQEGTEEETDTEQGLSKGTKKTASGATVATDTVLTPDQARAAVANGQLKSGDWFRGTDGQNHQIP